MSKITGIFDKVSHFVKNNLKIDSPFYFHHSRRTWLLKKSLSDDGSNSNYIIGRGFLDEWLWYQGLKPTLQVSLHKKISTFLFFLGPRALQIAYN